MDIRQWLQDTADRDAAALPHDNEPLPDFLRPRQGAAEEPRNERRGRSHNRKRKRASLDSSIIVPRTTNQKRAPLSAIVQNVQSAGSASAASHDSSASSATPSGKLDNWPERAFEKRARYKTKPERYEPKAGKQKKERKKKKKKQDGREEKPRSKRRKIDRGGDGARTAGLVQSFQLKGGGKNSRLTLRPDTSTGLFRHGRASGQINGRGGSGLPDLVFNEMRFLRRPQEHQDGPVEVKELKQSKKKERKQPDSEEISAYFGANQAAGANERDKKERARRPQLTANDEVERPRSRKRRDVVELPEIPFLGFGSQGLTPRNKVQETEGDSCYTWSESAYRKSSPPRARAPGAGKSAVREASLEHAQHRGKGTGEQQNGKQDALPHAQTAETGKSSGHWIRAQSRHLHGVELYQQDTSLDACNEHQRRDEQRGTPPSTRQPLPAQHTMKTSVEKPNLLSSEQTTDRDGNHQSSDTVKLQQRLKKLARNARVYHDDELHEDVAQHTSPQTEKENQDPLSSNSIDKLLDRVHHGFTKPEHHFDHDVQPLTRSSPLTQHFSNKIIEQLPDMPQHSVGRLPLPERGGPSAGALFSPPAVSRVPIWRQEPVSIYEDDAASQAPALIQRPDEQVEAFSTTGYTRPNFISAQHEYYSAADFTNPPSVDLGSEEFQPRTDDAAREDWRQWPQEIYLRGSSVSHARSIRGASVDREFESGQASDVRSGGVEEELAGFWKRQTLY